jgi:plasmid stabilization system protein ParE
MIRYRGGALRDLAGIAQWYRRERPAYEERFFTRLRLVLQRVAEEPLGFPVAMEVEGVRKARILRTDYSVAFIVPDVEEIEVIAITHGRRKPGWWRRRLREAGT